MTQWDSFQEYEDGSTHTNQETWYCTLRRGRTKTVSRDEQKSFHKTQYFFIIKNCDPNRHRRNTSEYSKGHRWNHNEVKMVSVSVGRNNPDAHITTFIQCSVKNLRQKKQERERNKRKTGNEEAKVITVCRCHYLPYRKPQRLLSKRI